MPRTTGPTPEWVERYTQHLIDGATIENAGRLAGGTSPRTVHYWLRKGKEEYDRLQLNPTGRARKTAQPYYQLYVQHQRALALFEQNLTRKIVYSEEHAPHVWKASMEVLKLRFPHRWGQKPNQDNTARNVILNVFEKLADAPAPQHDTEWETPG